MIERPSALVLCVAWSIAAFMDCIGRIPSCLSSTASYTTKLRLRRCYSRVPSQRRTARRGWELSDRDAARIVWFPDTHEVRVACRLRGWQHRNGRAHRLCASTLQLGASGVGCARLPPRRHACCRRAADGWTISYKLHSCFYLLSIMAAACCCC